MIRLIPQNVIHSTILVATFSINGSLIESVFASSDRTIEKENRFLNRLSDQGVRLQGPSRITFPDTSVTEYAQDVYSGIQYLRLTNSDFKNGWMLRGKVFQSQFTGLVTWEKIPAKLKFTSITWKNGGDGSTAGITISPDGDWIEADPSSGRGTYEIAFELIFQVPAFANADHYTGVSIFSIQ